jgi:hypothetical protein
MGQKQTSSSTAIINAPESLVHNPAPSTVGSNRGSTGLVDPEKSNRRLTPPGELILSIFD